MSIAGTVGAPTWGYSGDRAWHRFYIPLQKYGRCRQIRLWWHQMSPDVRILTDNQAVILLFKSGYWNKIWSEKTSFCVNVAWQSEFMRILCSSEQSNLCPCPTKDFCRTRTNLPAPRAGESAPKSRILEEKSTNQKSHVYGENNRDKDG